LGRSGLFILPFPLSDPFFLFWGGSCPVPRLLASLAPLFGFCVPHEFFFSRRNPLVFFLQGPGPVFGMPSASFLRHPFSVRSGLTSLVFFIRIHTHFFTRSAVLSLWFSLFCTCAIFVAGNLFRSTKVLVDLKDVIVDFCPLEWIIGEPRRSARVCEGHLLAPRKAFSFLGFLPPCPSCARLLPDRYCGVLPFASENFLFFEKNSGLVPRGFGLFTPWNFSIFFFFSCLSMEVSATALFLISFTRRPSAVVFLGSSPRKEPSDGSCGALLVPFFHTTSSALTSFPPL